MERAEKIERLETLQREISALLFGVRHVHPSIFAILCGASTDEAIDRFVERFRVEIVALQDHEATPKP